MPKSNKMSKKYYYRRAKSNWGSNIENFSFGTSFNTQNDIYITNTLCQNPVQANTTVNQTFTVKNVELQFKLESSASMKFDNLIGYIMYVPQGMQLSVDYPKQHPEYIMAYKFFGGADNDGSSITPGRNPATIKTRLARKLQTGDGIVFLITGKHYGTANDQLDCFGVVRWWTKAN